MAPRVNHFDMIHLVKAERVLMYLHQIAIYGADEVKRADSGKNKAFSIVQSARDAIWWVFMQVVKVLRVIKAAVQALLPEKFVVQVKSAVQSVRDRLMTAIIRSALAAWVVLFSKSTSAPRIMNFDSLPFDHGELIAARFSMKFYLDTFIYFINVVCLQVRNIMDRFGTRGVRMAWYDPSKVDASVLKGYTKVCIRYPPIHYSELMRN